jgi:hypothetical protein
MICGANGELICGDPITEHDEVFSKYFESTACAKPKAKKGAVQTFGRNQFNPRSFTVSPEIPRGHSTIISALVVEKAPCHCVDLPDQCVEIASKYHAALVNWVVSRAYSIDVESTASMARAVRYEEQFYRLIADGYMMGSKFGSGYYNGQEGKGDANATPRAAGIR